MQDQAQINNNTPVNNTGYPLNGGIRPNSPSFPAEMNPEIQALKAEIQNLHEKLQASELRNEFLREFCNEKETKFQQLLEVHKLILSSLKHN
jgi:flagellar biosynthesis/type III secretory pathway chaperone